ncbi:expressed unknown protein [Seminavis robusta]|uniref:VWFD domain-containing protein n=1 Tax=Seminavis robusta TaxID=568900 RepID=A0A9N8HXF4_9STRA|nr:expressed unknown protein [Seminavis robusta]|eukprot:Sro3074_g343230.1 n/a (520) ;mRNA; f:748-2650
MKLFLPIAIALAYLPAAVLAAGTGKTVLYKNDFEHPISGHVPVQTTDGCTWVGTAHPYINPVYGGQGGPDYSQTTHGTGEFKQVNTVEVNTISGGQPFKGTDNSLLGTYYETPPGTGGKYSIGAANYDELTLDFNGIVGQEFFTIEMDMAQMITSPKCENNANTNRTIDVPTMTLTLLQDDDRNGCTGSCNTAATINQGWERVDSKIVTGSRYYTLIDNIEIYVTTTSPPTKAPTPAPTSPPSKAPTPANVPAKTASSNGDPHFKTWTGEKFDFHGQCDLVLLSDPFFANELGLTIHIRTKITDWWSYIESAVIQLGDQSLELTGGSNGDDPVYWVNGVPGTSTAVEALETKLASIIPGFKVHYKHISAVQHKFRIDLNLQGDALSLETYKDWIAVNVKANKEEHFSGTLGLMGAFPSGRKVARDGTTVIEDPIEFGKHWQVQLNEPMLFHSELGTVQAPEECAMPSESTMKSRKRRLGESKMTMEAAKLACGRVDPSNLDSCVFDVLATQDKGVAGAY